MRKMIFAAAAALVIFVLASPAVMASEGNGPGEGSFIKNFYKWLRDDDGDGIPNCLDPDYISPQDGTGYGKLGPALTGDCDNDCDGEPDQIRLREQDQDQLKDGSCVETAAGNIYRLQYKGANSPK
jgi:hypothetical protein